MQVKNIIRIATVTASIAVVSLILTIAAPAAVTGDYSPSLSASAAQVVKVASTAPAYAPDAAAKQSAEQVADAYDDGLAYSTQASANSAYYKVLKVAGGEEAEAQAIVASLIKQYPVLKGTTVEFGDAHGYQAIAFYQSGRIIVSPDHTASLERILTHEVWHIIDYRDNGQIDWGEDIPRK